MIWKKLVINHDLTNYLNQWFHDFTYLPHYIVVPDKLFYWSKPILDQLKKYWKWYSTGQRLSFIASDLGWRKNSVSRLLIVRTGEIKRGGGKWFFLLPLLLDKWTDERNRWTKQKWNFFWSAISLLCILSFPFFSKIKYKKTRELPLKLFCMEFELRKCFFFENLM